MTTDLLEVDTRLLARGADGPKGDLYMRLAMKHRIPRRRVKDILFSYSYGLRTATEDELDEAVRRVVDATGEGGL